MWNFAGNIIHEVRKDKTVVDYRYDVNGNLNYHAVNGKEDTVKYLAMKKVAARQAERSEKLRQENLAAQTLQTEQGEQLRKPQVVKKLTPTEKFTEMLKARIEVRKELRG